MVEDIPVTVIVDVDPVSVSLPVAAGTVVVEVLLSTGASIEMKLAQVRGVLLESWTTRLRLPTKAVLSSLVERYKSM